MALKVIGAGLGRTGTFSLKLALEKLLGEPCYHMAEVFEHMDHCPVWAAAARGQAPVWNEFLTGYAAAVDWPAAAFWKELSEAFPEAIVILSIRDPREWWESAHATIFPAIGHMPNPEWRDMIDAIFAKRTHIDPADADECIEEFERHNSEVIRTVPSERLVVWNAKEGWVPLCAALGVPVPDEPFPKANTRQEFLQRMRDREAVQPGS